MNIGFSYQYRAISGFTANLRDDLGGVSDRIAGSINRHTADGVVPPVQGVALRRDADQAVTEYFGDRDAFEADGETARSPYARRLNYWLAFSTVGIVFAHQRSISTRTSPDIRRWLSSARPRALEYDSAHKWVDPRGWRLSDRIWRTDAMTRQKIDMFLADNISRGTSAQTMARRLEQFLVPGRAAIRTTQPYGMDASYDAMRLARTEITRASGVATIQAAEDDPYSDGVDWALSARHPRVDVCDAHATIGMGGNRLRDPYPPSAVPGFPPHPDCICSLSARASTSPSRVNAKLKEQMDNGEAPPFSPMAGGAYAAALIGAALAALVVSEFNRERERIPVEMEN